MSIMLLTGVGGSKKKVIYLAPCRFMGYVTDCWRFYSNYLKTMGDSFTLQTTDYYANYLKNIGFPIDAKEYFNTYSNYLKSLNGFFMPNPSSVYTV